MSLRARGLVLGLALFMGRGFLFLPVALVPASPAAAQQTEADIYVAEAILAYDDKRYPEALRLLEEALKVEPEHLQALYYSGLVLLALQQPDRAVQALEKARALAPPDVPIRYQLGVAYFSLERYEAAAQVLEPLFAEQPRLDGLGYYVGFLRYRAKDYRGAVQAFQTGAATDPNLQQLTRFYTGLALAILGLPERAAAEVAEALRIQPASPLTGPAERLRDTLVAARARERRFHLDLRLGAQFDDNVAVIPRGSADPTAQILHGRKHRSPGMLATGRAEYAWWREDGFEATAAYSFFQNLNNDLPEFNIQNHGVTLTGVGRGEVAALPLQVGGQYAYDWLTLGDNPFLQRHSWNLFGTLVESAGHLTSLQGRVQLKSFAADEGTPRAERRDAWNYLVGVTHFFRFAEDRHLLKVGYQFDVEEAKGSNHSYRGHRFLAGGQYTQQWREPGKPWGETRLKYDFEAHLRAYRNSHTLFPVLEPNTRARSDVEFTHVVRVEQPLPWSFLPDRADRLTLAAEYQSIASHSNLAVFSFNRNVYTLSVGWNF